VARPGDKAVGVVSGDERLTWGDVVRQAAGWGNVVPASRWWRAGTCC
jgi:hypothetical protein